MTRAKTPPASPKFRFAGSASRAGHHTRGTVFRRSEVDEQPAIPRRAFARFDRSARAPANHSGRVSVYGRTAVSSIMPTSSSLKSRKIFFFIPMISLSLSHTTSSVLKISIRSAGRGRREGVSHALRSTTPKSSSLSSSSRSNSRVPVRVPEAGERRDLHAKSFAETR